MKNWIAGFVAGALLFVLVPAQAHHRSSYSNLDNRIDRLEEKTAHLSSGGYLYPQYVYAPTPCGLDDPVLWDGSFAGLTC